MIFMKRLIWLSTILILSIIFIYKPLKTEASWIKDSNGWWNTEGSSWSVGWRNIDNLWYYFDQNGYMKTGWIKSDNKWYYLKEGGEMASNELIEGYYLGENGAWLENSPNELEIKLQEKVHNLGTKRMAAVIINNTDSDETYGEEYEIDKLENGKWIKLDNDELFGCNEVSAFIESHSAVPQEYYLTSLKDFENLKPGKYRIVHSFDMDELFRTVEFELK